MKKKLTALLNVPYKILLYFFAFLGIATVFMPNSNKADICADEGGVFDYEFLACRFDCHTWQKETGCDLITDEQLEEFVNDYCAHEGKGLYRCRQSALELSKRKLNQSLIRQTK